MGSQGLLEGLQVVDLTQNVAGPFCCQILADLGAEIVKIERPGEGDDARGWRPPELGGESATFLALNRSKRSVCIDIDQPDGREIVKDLARRADIFIHSLKPGSAERRGLGKDDLQGLNPRLIYCAVSAFGSTGPLAGLAGYDPLLQAFTGIMSVTGEADGPPVRAGVSLIDMGTGLWAAFGIMAALLKRKDTGTGGHVEASLLETGMSLMTVQIASFLATGASPRPMGSAMAMTAPYELFAAADGQVFIAAGNDRLFQAVCRGLGAVELADDPRFRTNALRVAHRAALHAALEALTCGRAAEEVVGALRGAGAPCCRLNDVATLLADEQVRALEIVLPLRVADAPEHKVVGLPLRLDGSRGVAARPPPKLGADTDAMLQTLGYDDARIAALRAAGAIG